jgi:hypothetical protein
MALMKCKECGTEMSTTAKACPKCGAVAAAKVSGKNIALGCLGAFVLLVIITMIGAISAKKNAGEVEVAKAELAGKMAAATAAETIQRAATMANPGKLTFGKPAVKVQMGMTQVAVEATNVSGENLTGCTATATFKKGDTIVGTANGAVNELAVGATKTVQLVGTDNVTGYDTVKIEASVCF